MDDSELVWLLPSQHWSNITRRPDHYSGDSLPPNVRHQPVWMVLLRCPLCKSVAILDAALVVICRAPEWLAESCFRLNTEYFFLVLWILMPSNSDVNLFRVSSYLRLTALLFSSLSITSKFPALSFHHVLKLCLVSHKRFQEALKSIHFP